MQGIILYLGMLPVPSRQHTTVVLVIAICKGQLQQEN